MNAYCVRIHNVPASLLDPQDMQVNKTHKVNFSFVPSENEHEDDGQGLSSQKSLYSKKLI